MKDAYISARALYDQLLTKNDVGHVATKLVSDEDVQAQLRNVVAQIRGAAGRAQDGAGEGAEGGAQRPPHPPARHGIMIGLLSTR